MRTRMICIVTIALAIAAMAGCSMSAAERKPLQAPSPSPTPTPKPTPSPTPVFSDAEKASLRARYAELVAITKASRERERLLHGTTAEELVCEADAKLEEAEEVKATVTDAKKGPYAENVVTAENAKGLVEQQLAIFAAYVIEAAKSPGGDFSCLRGEGRSGTASEALHDLVMRYDRHGVDVARSGMDLKAIRALALTRAREEIADVKAILAKKSADADIEKARMEWQSFGLNPWGFSSKELGITPEQVKMLEPAG